MGISARKISARPGQAGPSGTPGGDDPHDEIELAFLGLWLGISQLREQVRGNCGRRSSRAAVRPRKPPANRKPRKAA